MDLNEQKSQNSQISFQSDTLSEILMPERSKRVTKTYLFLSQFDLFQFIPTPQQAKVSTTKSLLGSIIAITVFLSYIIYSFVSFVRVNVPRINSYPSNLNPRQQLMMPEISIGYFYGNDGLKAFDFTNIFQLSLQELHSDPSKPQQFYQLQPCDQKSQLKLYPGLFCTTNNKLFLQSVYSDRENFSALKFEFQLCQNSTANNNSCKSFNEMRAVMSGGRIIIFLAKADNYNFATNLYQKTADYESFYFFLTEEYYNSVQFQMQQKLYHQQPDLFNRFTVTEFQDLVIKNKNFYSSQNVDKSTQFAITFSLDDNNYEADVQYQTFIDVISLWGAFWSVIFGMLVLYFLAHNQIQFYQQNPSWGQFDKTIKKMDQQKQQKREERTQIQK